MWCAIHTLFRVLCTLYPILHTSVLVCSTLCRDAPETKYLRLRGHLQTIVCMLNVIVTLLPDPPPPLLLTSHFVNLLKISNYVPKARAKYSSLLTKCIANMLELHLFFASFPFCCIRMKLLTSRPRPPHPLSVTMTLSIQIIVWRCPLTQVTLQHQPQLTSLNNTFQMCFPAFGTCQCLDGGTIETSYMNIIDDSAELVSHEWLDREPRLG